MIRMFTVASLLLLASVTLAQEADLRKELLDRVRKDQAAREQMIELMKRHGGMIRQKELNVEQKEEFDRISGAVSRIDRENTAWLKEIIDQQGFPTISKVGKDGSNAVWLLIQHADADQKFQRFCLDLMSKLPKEEISQGNLAYLTDRVLLAEGKKQIYGTQFSLNDGKVLPRPIEDEANVDKRRIAMGLSPLADYAKIIEEQYLKSKK